MMTWLDQAVDIVQSSIYNDFAVMLILSDQLVDIVHMVYDGFAIMLTLSDQAVDIVQSGIW